MPPKGYTKAAAAAAAAAVAQDKDGETLNGSPPPPVNSGPMSAAQKQAAPYMAGLHDFELPKSVIQRLAKGALPDNIKMQQEVTQALLRSSTVFINYLTAAAHEVAIARGAKSVTANDIMNAIEVIEFGPPQDLRPILQKELDAFKTLTVVKKARPSTGSAVGRRPSTGGNLKGKGKAATDAEGEGDVGEDEDNEMAVDDEMDLEPEGELEAELEGEGEDADQPEHIEQVEGTAQAAVGPPGDVEMNGSSHEAAARANVNDNERMDV